jgi:hypothetical protein
MRRTNIILDHKFQVSSYYAISGFVLLLSIFQRGFNLSFRPEDQLSIISVRANFLLITLITGISLIILTNINKNFVTSSHKSNIMILNIYLFSTYILALLLPLKYSLYPYGFESRLQGDSLNILAQADGTSTSYYPPLWPQTINLVSKLLNLKLADSVMIAYFTVIITLVIICFYFLYKSYGLIVTTFISNGYLIESININAPYKSLSSLLLFTSISYFLYKIDFVNKKIKFNLIIFSIFFSLLLLSWVCYAADIYFGLIAITILLVKDFFIPFYRESRFILIIFLILLFGMFEVIYFVFFGEIGFMSYGFRNLLIPIFSGIPNFSDAYFPSLEIGQLMVQRMDVLIILLIIIGLILSNNYHQLRLIFRIFLLISLSILYNRLNISSRFYETGFANLWDRSTFEPYITILKYSIFGYIFKYLSSSVRSKGHINFIVLGIFLIIYLNFIDNFLIQLFDSL